MSSVLTILMTCWLGSSACDRWAPTAASRMRATTVRATADVDVGLEQSGADLAQHLVDVVVGEPALAAEALEDSVEAIGQSVEHATRTLSAHQETPSSPACFTLRTAPR